MTMTHFPGGFPNGLTIRNVPVLNMHSGNVFWVDSNNGSDSNAGGTYRRPFATIDYAIGRCTANKGDKIVVKAGHAETIATASAITCDVAGVEIIGMGTGSERPTLTFSTSTAATVVVSAAGVTWRNIIGVCNVDQLVSPFSIQAANCTLDIEWQDSASNKEAVTAILGNSSADKLVVRLRYMGQTGGSHCVAPIQLVGTDEALIDVDFYGKASTAVVNFITTASTGVRVTGNFYNAAATDGSKNIVDTQGSSKWWADIYDGSAGMALRGGSSLPLSSASAQPGYVQRFIAAKVISNAATSLTTGASPVTLFNVTGDVVARVYATVQTGLTSTLNNGTLAVGVTGNTGSFIGASTMDGTQFPTGSVWVDTSPAVKSEVFSGTSLNWAPIAGGADIICTIATNSATAGALTFYCEWYPVSNGASVVAA